MISQPTRSTASLTSASSVRSPPSLSPPGAGKMRGQHRRVEDVEVEVHEHRPPVEQVGELGRALDAPDAARVEQDALARVDVAHAAHDDAGGVEAGPEAAVPDAARAGEAHAAEEARRRRLGRVEVGVGVEPEHPGVGALADERSAAS